MMKYLLLTILPAMVFSNSFLEFVTDIPCQAYDTLPSGTCRIDCGECFNPEGRPGAMCPDS